MERSHEQSTSRYVCSISIGVGTGGPWPPTFMVQLQYVYTYTVYINVITTELGPTNNKTVPIPIMINTVLPAKTPKNEILCVHQPSPSLILNGNIESERHSLT